MNNYVKSGYTSVIELGFMDLTEIDKIVCRDVGWNILNLLSFCVFVLQVFLAFLSLLVGMSTVHYNIGDGC